MDEAKVNQIYWELYRNMLKLEDNREQLSNAQKRELDELGDLLGELKTKASDAGVEINQKLSGKITIKDSDNWEQLLNTSICSDAILEPLKESLEPLKLTEAQVWNIIQLMDKYYQANVLNVSMKEMQERLETEQEITEADKKRYKEAAQAALEETAKTMDEKMATTFKPEVISDLFEYYWRNSGGLGVRDVAKAALPTQFKFINQPLFEKKFKDKSYSLGPITIKNISAQFSSVITYMRKTAYATTESLEFDSEAYMKAFAAFGRVTVSPNLLAEGQPKMNPSITLASFVPLEIDLGFIMLSAQIDFGKFQLMPIAESMVKEGQLKTEVCAAIFKGKANFLKLASVWGELETVQDGIDFLLDKCVLQVSLKMTVELDCSLLKKMVKRNLDIEKEKQKKLELDKDKKPAKAQVEIEHNGEKVMIDADDADFVKDVQKRSKVLRDNTDEFKKLVDTAAPDAKKKGVAKRMKDLFSEGRDQFKGKIDKLGKAAKEVVEETLKETGEYMIKKLGQKSVAQMAKLVARAVPVIGAVMAAYDTVMIIWAVCEFFGQDNWERHFENAGRVIGGWLKSWGVPGES